MYYRTEVHRACLTWVLFFLAADSLASLSSQELSIAPAQSTLSDLVIGLTILVAICALLTSPKIKLGGLGFIQKFSSLVVASGVVFVAIAEWEGWFPTTYDAAGFASGLTLLTFLSGGLLLFLGTIGLAVVTGRNFKERVEVV